jgi:hypothetical protein
MSGLISLVSSPGEGSTFVVDVPAAVRSDSSSRPPEILASAFPQPL